MKRNTLILCVLLLLFNTGCIRRPFVEDRTEIYLSLKVNLDIQPSVLTPEETDMALPELFRVCLCDRETGELVYEDFVGPEGGYIYPKAGTYNLLVYNFNTEATLIRNENNLYTAEAFTGEISKFQKSQLKRFLTVRRRAYELAKKKKTKTDKVSTENETKVPQEKIVNEPDHVFAGRKENLVIPQLQAGANRNLVIEVKAKTIVEVWNVKMTHVEGCQYISNVNALMTGMAESSMLYSEKDSDRPVTLFFGMKVGKDHKSLIASFRTFGKIPSSLNYLELDLNISDSGGQEHVNHFDVTDQFTGNEEHLIIVNQPIVIQPPKSGGFAPEVDDWDDVETDIII